MDPFWEKIVLIIIDKGLLAAAGAGIAYVAALALERYRRDQAMVLELGKLRAQAFGRLMSLLGEHEALMDALAGRVPRTPANASMIEALKKRADQISTVEIYSTVTRDTVLLDRPLRLRIRTYSYALHEIYPSVPTGDPLSTAELDSRRAKLRELRDAVLELVPPLPMH